MYDYISPRRLQEFWRKVKTWIEDNYSRKSDVYMKSETYSKSEIDAKFTEVYTQLNNVAEKEVT